MDSPRKNPSEMTTEEIDAEISAIREFYGGLDEVDEVDEVKEVEPQDSTRFSGVRELFFGPDSPPKNPSEMTTEEIDAEIRELTGKTAGVGEMFGVGVDELQMMGGSGIEALGAAIQDRDAFLPRSETIDRFGGFLEETGKSIVEQQEEDLQAATGRALSFEDVQQEEGIIPSTEAFLTFGKQQVAKQLPLLIGLGGSTAAGTLVGGPVGGTAAGLGLYSSIMGGEYYQQQKEAKERGLITQLDPAKALAAGALAAPLASIADRFLLPKMWPTGKFLQEGNLFTRVTKNTATGALVESATEVGEEVLGRYQAGMPLDDEEAMNAYREVAAAAGTVGGFYRGVAGAFDRGASPLATDVDVDTDAGADAQGTTSGVSIDDLVGQARTEEKAKNDNRRTDTQPVPPKDIDKAVGPTEDVKPDVGPVKPDVGPWEEKIVADSELTQEQRGRPALFTYLPDDAMRAYPTFRKELEDKYNRADNLLKAANKRLSKAKKTKESPEKIKELETAAETAKAERATRAAEDIGDYAGIKAVRGKDKVLEHLAGDIASEKTPSIKRINSKDFGDADTDFGALGTAARGQTLPTGEKIEGQVDPQRRDYFPHTGGKYGKRFWATLSSDDRRKVRRKAIELRTTEKAGDKRRVAGDRGEAERQRFRELEESLKQQESILNETFLSDKEIGYLKGENPSNYILFGQATEANQDEVAGLRDLAQRLKERYPNSDVAIVPPGFQSPADELISPNVQRYSGDRTDIYNLVINPRSLGELLGEDVLYHQTNLKGYRELFSRDSVSKMRRRLPIYLSPDRDLALGQAEKPEYTLEYNANRMNGRIPDSLANRSRQVERPIDLFNLEPAEVIANKFLGNSITAVIVKNKQALNKLIKELPKTFSFRQSNAFARSIEKLDLLNTVDLEDGSIRVPVKQNTQKKAAAQAEINRLEEELALYRVADNSEEALINAFNEYVKASKTLIQTNNAYKKLVQFPNKFDEETIKTAENNYTEALENNRAARAIYTAAKKQATEDGLDTIRFDKQYADQMKAQTGLDLNAEVNPEEPSNTYGEARADKEEFTNGETLEAQLKPLIPGAFENQKIVVLNKPSDLEGQSIDEDSRGVFSENFLYFFTDNIPLGQEVNTLLDVVSRQGSVNQVLGASNVHFIANELFLYSGKNILAPRINALQSELDNKIEKLKGENKTQEEIALETRMQEISLQKAKSAYRLSEINRSKLKRERPDILELIDKATEDYYKNLVAETVKFKNYIKNELGVPEGENKPLQARDFLTAVRSYIENTEPEGSPNKLLLDRFIENFKDRDLDVYLVEMDGADPNWDQVQQDKVDKYKDSTLSVAEAKSIADEATALTELAKKHYDGVKRDRNIQGKSVYGGSRAVLNQRVVGGFRDFHINFQTNSKVYPTFPDFIPIDEQITAPAVAEGLTLPIILHEFTHASVELELADVNDRIGVGLRRVRQEPQNAEETILDSFRSYITTENGKFVFSPDAEISELRTKLINKGILKEDRTLTKEGETLLKAYDDFREAVKGFSPYQTIFDIKRTKKYWDATEAFYEKAATPLLKILPLYALTVPPNFIGKLRAVLDLSKLYGASSSTMEALELARVKKTEQLTKLVNNYETAKKENRPESVLSKLENQIFELQYDSMRVYAEVYGQSSLSEFIAEAFSNRLFQDVLRKQKALSKPFVVKGTDRFQQFVDAVRTALNVDPKLKTALENVITSIGVLIGTPPPTDGQITASFANAAAQGGVEFKNEAQAKTKTGAVFRKLDAGTTRFVNEAGIEDLSLMSDNVASVLNAASQGAPYEPPLNERESIILANTASQSETLKEKVFGGVGDTVKNINENTPSSIDPIVDKVSESPSWFRRMYYGFLSLGQLADTVRRYNPKLANAIEAIERISSMRTARVEEIRMRFKNQIIDIKDLLDRANVSADTLREFNILAHQSTLADLEGNRYDLREIFLDPPDPNDANYEERMRTRNSDLFAEFAKFPQELHLVYKIIVDTYEIVGDQYMDSIQGQLLDTTVDDVTKSKLNAKINDRAATEEEKNEAREALAKLEERVLNERQKFQKSEFFTKRITPFIPLVRRGDYWIKEKVSDLEFKEEQKRIAEMEKGNYPEDQINKAKEELKQKKQAGRNAGRSWSFETEREAKREKRRLEKGGKDPTTGDVLPPVQFINEYGDNGVFTRSGNADIFESAILGESTKYREELRQLMVKLKQMGYTDAKDPVTGEYEDARMAELLRDLQEKFLDTHSNESLVQQWKSRREIPGYQIDLVENFAHMGMKYANQIALLETAPELTRTTLAARQLISSRPSSVERSVDQTLKGRASFLRDPTPARWAALAAYGGYSWFILGNISSAVVNLSQLPLLGYGLMSGEFGYKAAGDALLSTMRLYSTGGRDDNTNLKIGKVSLADWTLFSESNLNADVLKKYGLTVEEMKELRDLGLSRSRVRRSSAQELQDVRRGTTKGITGLYAKAELAGGWAFQNTERLNREVGLVMAYRLAKGKYKNATREQNMERALQIVEEMNGPALAEIGPEWLQDRWGKTLGVFKKFAFAMTYIQWKILRDAFLTLGEVERNPNLPAEMPSVQELARRQVLSTMIPAFMFAGIRGLPFIGAGHILYTMLADDDDPAFDEWTRGMVGDIAYRGPLSHYMNVDFASRTGYYSMLYRDDPYRRSKVGDAAYAFESFMGPVYSATIGNLDRGIKFYDEGRTFDAIQAVTPSWLRNQMKAYDLAMNGALNSKGYPIVEDVNGYNVAMQFFGFSPNDVSRAYEKNEFLSRQQKSVYNKRSKLLTQYYMALKMGDTDEVLAIREKMVEFNKDPLVIGMDRRISGETISKSVRMRERKSREAIDGLVLPRRERIAIERELGYS